MSRDRGDQREPETADHGDRAQETADGRRGFALSRRQVLIGGGAAAVVAAGGWYGPSVIGDGFERHVADVLGISEELARALTEHAREGLGGRYELQAAQFLAATKFPGSELPSGVRDEGVRSLLEAMLDDIAGKTAYAGLIRPSDIDSPCPALGPG
jgi:hypothetical protein